MFQILEAETANELWEMAAGWFLPDGIGSKQSGRGGVTAEVLRAALTIREPRQRWISSRVPAMSPAFAIAEVIWILQGRNDSGFLNYFNQALPKYAGDGDQYHGAYGFRLRAHFGFDQLQRAYEALSQQTDSRQVVLQIWDGGIDMPNSNGSPRSQDIPCNIVSLLKVRDGRLEWTQVMRSNDLFRGLPHNIVQFTSLQEVMAGWLGLESGGYHHFSDSLHLYAQDGAVAERVAHTTPPPNQDSLALPKDESERAFQRLGEFADALRTDSLSEASLCAIQNLGLDPAFANLASILAAEAMRRRRSYDAMQEVLSRCSNPCLVNMFGRWLERWNGLKAA
jgi:thymidylate synthase